MEEMYGVHGWPQQIAMRGLVSKQTLPLLSSAKILSPAATLLCRLQLVLKIHKHTCSGLLGFLQYQWASEGLIAGGAEATILFQGKEIFLDILLKQHSFAAFIMQCS